MTKIIGGRARSTVLLVGVLAAAFLAAPATPLAALPAHGAAGFGFWASLSCIGCIGGFVIGGGATVAGLAVFIAANPEIAIYCVSACAMAAT